MDEGLCLPPIGDWQVCVAEDRRKHAPRTAEISAVSNMSVNATKSTIVWLLAQSKQCRLKCKMAEVSAAGIGHKGDRKETIKLMVGCPLAK